MKKFIYIIIGFVTLSLSACDTTSSSDGDLDNWWYLTKIDTLSSGNSTEYRQHCVFWAFQGTLMQVKIERTGIHTSYICKFQKTGNTLYQNQLYRYDRVNGDVPMNQDSIYQYNITELGISQPVDTFTVESLNGDNMILKNRTLRLHFEKY